MLVRDQEEQAARHRSGLGCSAPSGPVTTNQRRWRVVVGMPVGWVIHERTGIESAVEGTDITVRVLGRMAGLSRVLHLLGYRDTTTARRLTELAGLQADLTASAIAATFARPPDLAAGVDSTG